MTTERDTSKLPKWAQQHILHLEARLANQQQELEEHRGNLGDRDKAHILLGASTAPDGSHTHEWVPTRAYRVAIQVPGAAVECVARHHDREPSIAISYGDRLEGMDNALLIPRAFQQLQVCGMEYSRQAARARWLREREEAEGVLGGMSEVKHDMPRLFPYWVPVSEGHPTPGTPVLVFVQPGPDRTTQRCLRAQWSDGRTLEVGSDYIGAFGEEDENGTVWCPEGWYETNERDDTCWQITDPVSHWMPLPDNP